MGILIFRSACYLWLVYAIDNQKDQIWNLSYTNHSLLGFVVEWNSEIIVSFYLFLFNKLERRYIYIWKSWIIGTIEVIIQPKRWYIASSFTAWSYLKASGMDEIWELLDLFPLGQRLIIHAWGHSMRFGWHLFIVYHGVTTSYIKRV